MICTTNTDHVLSSEECKLLIDYFHSKEEHHFRTDTIHRVDTTLDAAQFDSFRIHKKSIIEAIRKPLHDYFTMYNLNPEYDISGFKIQHSAPGEGFFGWHHDGVKGENRRLVWMIYLNDTDGGDTEFRNDYNVYGMKPETGKLFLFPAHFTHTHRSSPNLKSDKYIITGWIHDQN